jgi:mono/diheme cytochrome c family protein
MRNRFYIMTLFIAGVVLLAFTLFAAYKEMNPEWKAYQKEYKELLVKGTRDEATKKKARELETNIQQLYLGGLKRIDRCTSCHVGIENPLMANAKVPYRQHSGDYLKKHPMSSFGCTVCHLGQGRATNKKEAHGLAHDTHWDYPVIPLKYIQSACVQCHDLDMLKQKGADKIVKGEQLLRENGCMGCHKLNNIGGVLGKALDIIGSQPRIYFPMGFVVGEKTPYSWIKQHFDDPRAIVPVSEMKVKVTEAEADLLTTYVASLRAEEMPKSYRRILETQKDGKTSEDGEALYKKYCIACHEKGKDSLFDEIFMHTIPAIVNPAFLKVVTNDYLKKVVEEGRAGTQMTAWKASAAGLSGQAIDNIVDYLTSKRPKEKAVPFNIVALKGDLKKGEELYKVRCALCHGANGKGELGINLRNPVVQGADITFLAMTVRDGREGTPMPSFGKNGVGLSDQDIVDTVSYVKTISKKK